MSLINQMLRDLDERADRGSGPVRAVQPDPVPRKGTTGNHRWLLYGLILLLLTAAGYLWYAYWLVPEGGAVTAQLQVSEPVQAVPVKIKRLVPLESGDAPMVAPSAADSEPAPSAADLERNGPTSSAAETDSQAPGLPIATTPEMALLAGLRWRESPGGSSEVVNFSSGDGLLRHSIPHQEAEPTAAGIPTAEPADPPLRMERPTRPAKVAPLTRARRFIEEGRLAEAEQLLWQQLHNLKGRELLARLLLRGGRLGEARSLLDQGLEKAPEHLPFILLRARIDLERGDIPGARALIEGMVSEHGGNLELLSLLGTINQQQGRSREALQIYRRIIALEPGSARAWAGLAMALDSLGRRSAAVEAYRHALSLRTLPAAVSEYARQRISSLEQAGRRAGG